MPAGVAPAESGGSQNTQRQGRQENCGHIAYRHQIGWAGVQLQGQQHPAEADGQKHGHAHQHGPQSPQKATTTAHNIYPYLLFWGYDTTPGGGMQGFSQTVRRMLLLRTVCLLFVSCLSLHIPAGQVAAEDLAHEQDLGTGKAVQEPVEVLPCFLRLAFEGISNDLPDLVVDGGLRLWLALAGEQPALIVAVPRCNQPGQRCVHGDTAGLYVGDGITRFADLLAELCLCEAQLLAYNAYWVIQSLTSLKTVYHPGTCMSTQKTKIIVKLPLDNLHGVCYYTHSNVRHNTRR
nr:MAG TPA: hypothetical protein [Caudoviricetes sp.]